VWIRLWGARVIPTNDLMIEVAIVFSRNYCYYV
jgi:hypothetical protein